MIVTSVRLLSNNEEALQFDLRNVDSSGPYTVRAIVGLDADEIIPKFYGFGLNGQKFYDFGLKPRDIVIRIALNPRYKVDESVSYIRDKVYRAISSTRTGLLELQFHAGGSAVSNIHGFMTKFEVPHFSATPEIQITLRCNDPMFRSINHVLMEDTLPATGPVMVPDSISTAPHGFVMQLTFNAATTEFVVQDDASDPSWKFRVVPASSFLSGDVLYFSSEFTNKYLYFDRGGTITHLMHAIEPTSIWPIIFPGFNEFHFPQIANFDWNHIQFHMAYWGV